MTQDSSSEAATASATPAPVKAIDEVIAPQGFERRALLPFPVCGIGASAGGLEPFKALFAAMPPDTGMAFVLIQHLPPKGESLLAEILQRSTQMPVRQIEDGVAVEPNHVYCTRPGYTVTLEGGRLRLGESTQARGHRKPIDDFFRSLAAEQQEKSIAVILSGMGMNGSAGAQAVKAAGGICIAQDPQTAEFSSMPHSLIESGYADAILPPQEIPQALIRFVRHPYIESPAAEAEDLEQVLQRERPQLNEILAILRTHTGRDFRGYKRPTLFRRIHRRMGIVQVITLSEYAALLRRRPEEAVALGDDLTINVTGFFRDADAWEALRAQVIRPLLLAREARTPIRAWVAACSSGEEAYTLAMVMAEECAALRKSYDIKIFATDLAEKTLGHARAGVYPGGIEGDIDTERLDRFFEKDDQAYRIRKEIREMVVFAPQNLLSDPPFSRLDLITCRNLLIYLEAETQSRLLGLLHFALREGGALFLGNSETPGPGAEDAFIPIDKKCRIYRRVGPTKQGTLSFPMSTLTAGPEGSESARVPARQSITLLLQRLMTERYGPPSVVVDRRYRILYYHGSTERFLLQPTGEPTSSLLDLVRDPLRPAVRLALSEAMEKGEPSVRQGRLEESEGPFVVQVTASPLDDGRLRDHFIVSFAPEQSSAAPARTADTVGNFELQNELERELRTVREELQTTIEELETSNEELKASYEEVSSVNEELQSSNEELETSKEELQSLNEELTTVNAQLQAKIEELENSTNDLTNLLASTHIAVLFLDTQLLIRRFTPAVKDLLELIGSDVGRPIAHMAQKFSGGDLVADAQAVLERLVPREAEVRSHSGRSYLRRILPYRSSDNRIEGVVVTFIDIDERKAAEVQVRHAQQRLQMVIEQMPSGVLIAEPGTGRLLLANQRAAEMLGFGSASWLLGREWDATAAGFTGYRPDGRSYARDEWPLARTLRSGERVLDEEIVYRRADGRTGAVSVSSVPIVGVDGRTLAIVVTFWEISERKRVEREREEARSAAELANRAKDEFIAVMSHELRTPLASILIWTRLLQRDDLSGETMLEGIGVVERAARAQQQLIDDLLDVSRMNAGKLALSPRPCRLAGVIQAAFTAAQPAAKARGVQLEIELGEDIGTVVADSERLQQVLWNLLSNAVKFTPAGGVATIRAWRRGDEIAIGVTDTGIGIRADVLPHIFERFTQGQSGTTRQHGGLGLGLAIASQLVEMHGGSISCASKGEGLGATFTVLLPMPAQPLIAAADGQELVATPTMLAERYILLVEDDPSTRNAVATLLRLAGAEVCAVDCVGAALDAFSRRAPDLLISDIAMAEADGYSLIQQLRSRERATPGRHIPALALTALARKEDRARALAAGFDEHLSKPANPDCLVAVARRLASQQGSTTSG